MMERSLDSSTISGLQERDWLSFAFPSNSSLECNAAEKWLLLARYFITRRAQSHRITGRSTWASPSVKQKSVLSSPANTIDWGLG